MANSRRGLMMSGRLRIADISVPITNPPWTAMVSHAVSADVRWNSATMGAFAAVGENQNVIPGEIAGDNQAGWDFGEGAASAGVAQPPENFSIHLGGPQSRPRHKTRRPGP